MFEPKDWQPPVRSQKYRESNATERLRTEVEKVVELIGKENFDTLLTEQSIEGQTEKAAQMLRDMLDKKQTLYGSRRAAVRRLVINILEARGQAIREENPELAEYLVNVANSQKRFLNQ